MNKTCHFDAEHEDVQKMFSNATEQDHNLDIKAF